MSLRAYGGIEDLPPLRALIEKDLSEPYSTFTYRYFVDLWPSLTLLAETGEGACVGTIVCMVQHDKKRRMRGYIAMLAVARPYRGRGIASRMVREAVRLMRDEHGAELVVLETEATNRAAIALYEGLDFVRDKRLQAYYLNGGDAFRLKLHLAPGQDAERWEQSRAAARVKGGAV